MDAYQEEYENYEPELKVWPYITLGLLVPAVPFITNILFYKNGLIAGFNLIYSIVFCAVLATAYFVTANVIRTARGSWVYALLGALMAVLQLVMWSYYKIKGVQGYPLSRPFLIALVPAFALLMAYAFYARRSRLPAWGTSSILTFLFSLGSGLYIYFLSLDESIDRIVHLLYISQLALLSLFMFFVTKRSETSPWYINIVLVGLVFTSIAVSPGFTSVVSSPSEVVLFIFKSIAINYDLWFYISLCFVFAGLGMKSCFKTLKIEEDEDLDQLVTRVNSRVDEQRNSDVPPAVEHDYIPPKRYSYPPETDRFSSFGSSDGRQDKEDEHGYEDDGYYRPRTDYRDRDYPGKRREYRDRDDYYGDYRPRRTRPIREQYDEYDDYDDYYDRPPRARRERDDYYREDDYYVPRRDRSVERRERRVLLEEDERDDYRRSKRYSNERDKWLDLLSTSAEDDYDDRR